MADFINNILFRVKQKDILIRLIVINICVFIILAVVNLISVLFQLPLITIIDYIGISSDSSVFIWRPWTFFTYMFVHKDLWHILFNMLLLYWFGKIFLTYFSPKNLGSLYILGGVSGALLYILAFNTIPYYLQMNHPIMIGASASVMAIIFAAAFYNPAHTIGLLFIGQIKIIYIALFFFVIDFISLGDFANPGGHVAHIGGAALGYLYAKQYLKGKDITRWFNKIIDSIADLFKPKPKQPKMKVKYRKFETDYDYNQRKNQQNENIDRILDKIKASGYSSLTENEKKQLFEASKK